MFDRQTALDLARVRLLALRALVAAGGRPRPGQLRRAVRPLAEAGLGLEDLVAIGGAAGDGRPAEQLLGGGRPGAHVAAGCASGLVHRAETVDSGSDQPPWE
jgi:hypothetical protein